MITNSNEYIMSQEEIEKRRQELILQLTKDMTLLVSDDTHYSMAEMLNEFTGHIAEGVNQLVGNAQSTKQHLENYKFFDQVNVCMTTLAKRINGVPNENLGGMTQVNTFRKMLNQIPSLMQEIREKYLNLWLIEELINASAYPDKRLNGLDDQIAQLISEHFFPEKFIKAIIDKLDNSKQAQTLANIGILLSNTLYSYHQLGRINQINQLDLRLIHLTNAAMLAASRYLPADTAEQQIQNLELNIVVTYFQPCIIKMAYCLLNPETVSKTDFISTEQNFQSEFRQIRHATRLLETASKTDNSIRIKPDFQTAIKRNPYAERQGALISAFRFFREKLLKINQLPIPKMIILLEKFSELSKGYNPPLAKELLDWANFGRQIAVHLNKKESHLDTEGKKFSSRRP